MWRDVGAVAESYGRRIAVDMGAKIHNLFYMV